MGFQPSGQKGRQGRLHHCHAQPHNGTGEHQCEGVGNQAATGGADHHDNDGQRQGIARPHAGNGQCAGHGSDCQHQDGERRQGASKSLGQCQFIADERCQRRCDEYRDAQINTGEPKQHRHRQQSGWRWRCVCGAVLSHRQVNQSSLVSGR